MPRHCSYFNVDGHAVIACGGTKIQACLVCGEIAGHLCDWKMGKNHTCDVPLCNGCAISVGKNKDLCPWHANAWIDHPANKQQALAL